MAKLSTDPLRSKLLELISDADGRLANIRDYGSSPGNIWLAKGELQSLITMLSEMETLLEDIKLADHEVGY